MIEDLLAGGKTGRLYKKLVDELALASAVSASHSSGRYAGWFGVQVEVLDGKSREAAEKAVVEELKKLQQQPVSAEELARVKRGLLAHTVFARESVHGLADSIAQGVCTNDLDFLKTYLPRIQEVTQEDVQKAAREFFNFNQEVVVWSIPKAAKGGAGATPNAAPKQRRYDRDTPKGAGSGFSLKDTQRHVLPNGLTLLLRENRRLPIVVADVSLRYSSLLVPEAKGGVGALVGSLLDEGTAEHTGSQIAEMIENVGGALEMHSSGGSIKVLSGDRDLGLGLLFECLSRRLSRPMPSNAKRHSFCPLWKIRSVNPIRGLVASSISWLTASILSAAILWERCASLGALTPADCKAFYQEAFVPNNTICVVVGDFDSKQMVKQIERLTANWKSTKLDRPITPEVTKPGSFVQKVVVMPEAAQLNFYMGHVGIRRSNPDFYRLLVMDYVLGTSTGFNDRLSARFAIEKAWRIR